MLVTFRHRSGKTKKAEIVGENVAEVEVKAANWLAMELAGEGKGEQVGEWAASVAKINERAIDTRATFGKETRG